MAKPTLKILRYEDPKIFKARLAILKHYVWKGYIFVNFDTMKRDKQDWEVMEIGCFSSK